MQRQTYHSTAACILPKSKEKEALVQPEAPMVPVGDE